jgi:hypothetical protein
VRRFHDLYCGLARETAIPHAEDNDPLHFLERRAYKAAVHRAIAGLEDARVALATAIQRIEEGAAKTERQIEAKGNAGGGREKPAPQAPLCSVPSRPRHRPDHVSGALGGGQEKSSGV